MQDTIRDFQHLALTPIGEIHTDFPAKFGIPRQGALVEKSKGTIVFRADFRKTGILKGLDGFSHIWLIWGFNEETDPSWSATVRPPRLGGSATVGVFACRSPRRPNPLGLTCVKIEAIREDARLGPVIEISGVDMKDGSPLYDIKPYVPLADRIDTASAGFTQPEITRLSVIIDDELKNRIPSDKLSVIEELLALDPRPAYKKESDEIYGLSYADMNIRFTVKGRVLTVTSVERINR